MNLLKTPIFRGLSLAAVICTTFFGVSAPSATAAESTEISAELLAQASIYLETDLAASPIAESLQEALTEAIDAEVIDPEILDATETAVDAGAELDLTEDLAENAVEQDEIYQEQAPLWAAAFETVKADFQACREASTNSRECARGLGFKLQIAKEGALLETIDQRIADLGTLPAEEQAAELSLLTQLQQRSATKLASAQQKLTKFSAADSKTANEVQTQVAETQVKLKKSKIALKEKASVITNETIDDTDSVSTETTEDPESDKGSGDKGNGGNNGKNNGKGNSGK